MQTSALAVTYATGVTSVSAADLNLLDSKTNQTVTATPTVANSITLTGVGALDANGDSG